jgi:Tfp pilus assembly protein PilN
MKRTLVTALLMLSLSATPALAGPTLKQQLAAQKAKVAKLQTQLKKTKSAAKAHHRKDASRIAGLIASATCSSPPTQRKTVKSRP